MIDFDNLPPLPELPPWTLESWRMFKAATRHRKRLQRLVESDQAGAAEWLAAVERDDVTDPHERTTHQQQAAA